MEEVLTEEGPALYSIRSAMKRLTSQGAPALRVEARRNIKSTDRIRPENTAIDASFESHTVPTIISGPGNRRGAA